MDAIILQSGRRRGRVELPWSKSHLHRLRIADFLAGKYRNLPVDSPLPEDVVATQRALASLDGVGDCPVLECGESGATLRFLLPVAMACRKDVVFTGEGRLPQRPLAPFLELLCQHGVNCEEPRFPLHLTGGLEPGIFTLRGDISSQIVTGLLFALPLLSGDSRIVLITPLESRGYVEMTIAVLREYGIHLVETEDGFQIPGRQHYCAPEALLPERDWSSAAFWTAMNHLGSQIQFCGMDPLSAQPDRCIGEALHALGGEVCVAQSPDLFPVLAIAAGAHSGRTVFTGVRRLRLKESDRLDAMAEVLALFGVRVKLSPEAFDVEGVGPHFRGNATIPSFGDHRIAMAAALGATLADAPVVIQNPGCVAKSYPEFFEQFLKLECIGKDEK